MATEEGLKSASFKAGEDLSSLQYYLVKFSADDTVKSASDTDNVVGVLQNEPGNGETAEVAYEGKSKIVASASISAGDFLGSTANGKAVKVTASEGGSARAIVGICAQGASADGNVGSVLLDGRIG